MNVSFPAATAEPDFSGDKWKEQCPIPVAIEGSKQMRMVQSRDWRDFGLRPGRTQAQMSQRHVKSDALGPSRCGTICFFLFKQT
jgi:hypothetical protein